YRPHPSLGSAYQVFIPYVRKAPWQANCALRVRYSPVGGRPLFSELVHVTLPGPQPPTKVSASAETSKRKATGRPDLQLGAKLEHKRFSAADGHLDQLAPATDTAARIDGRREPEIALTGG